MIINTIYSNAKENVTLDLNVEIMSDDIDTTSNEYKRVCELLFDGKKESDRDVQNALTDLPEIKNYIVWAEAKMDEDENAFIAKYEIPEDDGEYVWELRQAWWEQYGAAEWPTWEKYNK